MGIGVFDSGIGGLTVFQALREALPATETLVYLGDTARVPYGTKSDETVIRYALEGARFLKRRGVKALVVACNTMSAVALPALQREAALPVVGVIGPGAEAACRDRQERRLRARHRHAPAGRPRRQPRLPAVRAAGRGRLGG